MPKVSEADRNKFMHALLAACHPVEKGGVVDRYLAVRGVDEPKHYPGDLFTCEKCGYSDGAHFPALVGVIRDVAGNIVSLHRTYLTAGCKADVPEPRRLMPGSLPDGVAIRLGQVNSVLGIAEGSETALAADH